jgi:hypothetical protein
VGRGGQVAGLYRPLCRLFERFAEEPPPPDGAAAAAAAAAAMSCRIWAKARFSTPSGAEPRGRVWRGCLLAAFTRPIKTVGAQTGWQITAGMVAVIPCCAS